MSHCGPQTTDQNQAKTYFANGYSKNCASQHFAFTDESLINGRRLTGDRLGAGGTPLGEKFSEALGAVRLVVAGREPLTGQRLDAVCAGEALAMPRLVAVRHAALSNNLPEKII